MTLWNTLSRARSLQRVRSIQCGNIECRRAGKRIEPGAVLLDIDLLAEVWVERIRRVPGAMKPDELRASFQSCSPDHQAEIRTRRCRGQLEDITRMRKRVRQG